MAIAKEIPHCDRCRSYLATDAGGVENGRTKSAIALVEEHVYPTPHGNSQIG
jgi:hypothetical protein